MRRILLLNLIAALTVWGCSNSNTNDKPPVETPDEADASGDRDAPGDEDASSLAEDPSLQLSALKVSYEPALDALVFEIEVKGDAASTVPEPAGQLDGAPVLGYVMPTTLDAATVGFGAVDGTVALVVTSHPDFDDTPLWDEDSNDTYDDDGAVYHTHWVVLSQDDRAPAGLAVVQSDDTSQLPPTAPMEMYLDSPGFTVIESGSKLRVIVPADRVQRQLDFQTGAQTALMRVDASQKPLLAVHEVFSKLNDGNPGESVTNASAAPESAWPQASDDEDSLQINGASATYIESLETFVFSIEAAGQAATVIPEPAGTLDGAPVLGYVFPTDMPPATVGFQDTDGQLVLAVTTHPDFDDTPLWDEDFDGDYENDGRVYHVHWAVLADDEASPAGLSVPSQPDKEKLPPTAPMAMYLDSPGYHAFASGNTLRVLVPGWHLGETDDFAFDALAARMRVDASGDNPVLRVEEVLNVLSGDLSMPLSPTRAPAVDALGAPQNQQPAQNP